MKQIKSYCVACHLQNGLKRSEKYSHTTFFNNTVQESQIHCKIYPIFYQIQHDSHWWVQY